MRFPTCLINLFAGALGVACSFFVVQTNATTLEYDFNVGMGVPDNDLSGLADTRNLVSDITSITDVRVIMNVTGGYIGDFYVYLAHDGAIAVLLNRAGRSATDPFGYADSGFSITFDDNAGADVHNYKSGLTAGAGILTGVWQPDARNVLPGSSDIQTPRSAFLSSFDGMSASGDWTLFLADVSPVGGGTLIDWHLEVTGEVTEVPDRPNTCVLLMIGLVTIFCASACSHQRARCYNKGRPCGA